jgi:hypothetical protein
MLHWTMITELRATVCDVYRISEWLVWSYSYFIDQDVLEVEMTLDARKRRHYFTGLYDASLYEYGSDTTMQQQTEKWERKH